MSSFLGALGGSILNWISNQYNNALQIHENRSQRDWNAHQATIAWDRSVEQWNRENEYNSPLAQMQRLREAGINPALAYASGVFNQAGTSPQADMPSSPGKPNTSPNQVDPYFFANLGLINSQMEEHKAIADKASAEADYYRANIPYIQQKIRESEKQIDVFNENILKTQAEVRVLDEDAKKRKAETAHIKFLELMDEKRFALEKEELEKKAALWKSQGKEAEANAAYAQAKAALTRSELQFFVDTYGVRVLGLKLDVKAKAGEIAELNVSLKKAGVIVDWTTGEISVDPNLSTGLRSGPVYSYASMIAELLGSVFGVVLPVGKSSKAVKATTNVFSNASIAY